MKVVELAREWMPFFGPVRRFWCGSFGHRWLYFGSTSSPTDVTENDSRGCCRCGDFEDMT